MYRCINDITWNHNIPILILEVCTITTVSRFFTKFFSIKVTVIRSMNDKEKYIWFISLYHIIFLWNGYLFLWQAWNISQKAFPCRSVTEPEKVSFNLHVKVQYPCNSFYAATQRLVCFCSQNLIWFVYRNLIVFWSSIKKLT